jgi:hypothetical protein
MVSIQQREPRSELCDTSPLKGGGEIKELAKDTERGDQCGRPRGKDGS